MYCICMYIAWFNLTEKIRSSEAGMVAYGCSMLDLDIDEVMEFLQSYLYCLYY